MTSSKRPSITFIAFPFPPSRGAGVYRSVAMTNYLVEAGWRVTVIAPDEGYFLRYQGTEDRSLMSWVHVDAHVVRVPLTNWLREDHVSRMPFLRTVSPRLFKGGVVRIQKYLSPLDHYPFWLRPALKATRREARRRHPDVVLATGNPFNSFVVAASIGRQFNVPYVLDYRDSWTFDQFTGEIKALASDVALPMERRLLHRASAFISVNQPILDWLASTHAAPNSVRRMVVPNGYDPQFVAKSGGHRNRTGPVRYAHVGTLVPQKMDWHAMLRQFDSTAQEMAGNTRLDVYGHLGFSTGQEADLRHLFDSATHITYHGPVQRHDISAIYDAADVLYLPLYESAYVTSGKVYEMMATHKPILAWGSDSAGALEPLRGYPKLVRADPLRPGSLTRAVAAANELSGVNSPELEARTLEYVKAFSRERALQSLDPLLRTLIG